MKNTFYAVGNSVGYVQQGSNIASMKKILILKNIGI